ncbi:hypothetical protein RBB78_02170 [Tunturiibacter empetritectus]|uniref:hypothetical protein n=1 Tax=Tunturiibacter empetritectus TaxID=3069691 RepID=UPI003D9B2718
MHPAFAVILSAAKDPDELRHAQTARPFPPTLFTQLLFLIARWQDAAASTSSHENKVQNRVTFSGAKKVDV